MGDEKDEDYVLSRSVSDFGAESQGCSIISLTDLAILTSLSAASERKSSFQNSNLAKIKFGSTDDLYALAAHSFAGTRTAKLITQYKDWDHHIKPDDKKESRSNSTDNLLEEGIPHPQNDDISKYYVSYNLDKAKAAKPKAPKSVSRRIITEGPLDEIKRGVKNGVERGNRGVQPTDFENGEEDSKDFETERDSPIKKLKGIPLMLEHIFHVEERG
jgi:hypothetical protein